MIPPLLGALILLATLGIVALTLVAMILARLRGQTGLFRAALTVAAATVSGYGLLWAAGLLTAPDRVVPRGEEIHFCGVDCHLHVSVVKTVRPSDLAVTMRFRSDARGADEFPGLLTIVAVDSSGRRYPPSSGMIAEPLKAGESIEREFRFAIPAGAGPARLVVSYEGVMDFLVPGQANPLAQRKQKLDAGA